VNGVQKLKLRKSNRACSKRWVGGGLKEGAYVHFFHMKR